MLRYCTPLSLNGGPAGQVIAGALTVPHGHLQGVDGQVRAQRPGGLPADDHPGVDVDDEGHVDPAGVRLDVGQIGDPQPVRGRRPELSLDQISRSMLTVIGAGRDLEHLAAAAPAQALGSHQALHGATSHADALPG